MIKSYEDFKTEILRLTDIDLNLYQEKQMKRRIDALITKLGLRDYEEYVNLLSSDSSALKAFLEYITINVSSFFRTPDQWEFMVDYALKELSGKKRIIRAWSIACSTGEEPYSLAISMMERYPSSDIEILATDIDEEVLAHASLGEFSPRQMESVPPDIREKYFTVSENRFRIRDEVREKVHFEKMNLLKFNYPKDMDLILSRNVLIYFTKEAKDRAFLELYRSLSEGGFLFSGNTEQIIYYKSIGFQKIKPFLYQKPATGGSHNE